MRERVVIMGAAGRDFHNFNVYFRGNPRYEVVAFTATQIPDIHGRRYPAELAGPHYPEGIPIHADAELESLLRSQKVDVAVFAYSDIPHEEVMHKASIANAAGADFLMIAAPYTMLQASKPVVSVCAVRTGCGKSQTSREVLRVVQAMGKRAVCVRHPMPYGDLAAQAVQRFASMEDLDTQHCTIEEREEFEPYVRMGATVYAGVDYERILRRAEAEADVIIWDGGNNDTPFYMPDLHVVVFDPHRPGHELRYHPGETNMRMADVAVINKVDSAPAGNVAQVRANIEQAAPGARIVLAESELQVEEAQRLAGARVLVVEDGPTLTHGEMAFGAGLLAAERHGAGEIVDPRPFARGSIAQTFAAWPHLQRVLPAMGYGEGQMRDLEATINAADCDLVLSATPTDLGRLLRLNKPLLRVEYAYKNAPPAADDHSDAPSLEALLRQLLG